MPPIRAVVEVDPARRDQWLLPSALRYVDTHQIRYLLPVDERESWVAGDLLLAEVDGPPGLVCSIQNTTRRSPLNYRDTRLFPGSKLVVVLSPRAGSSTCIARVPEKPVACLDLHGVGGQAGVIDPASQNSALYAGPPTTIKVLARLGDAGRRPLSMRDFALSVPAEPHPRHRADPPLVLVVGSDMDAGKTTTARRVVYALRAMGHRVAAGKATGVASLADLTSMYDAGASEVLDFAALGEPATIGLTEDEILSIFHRLFNHLRAAAGASGYVVMEFADGIWYRETRMLLEHPQVRDLVTDVVFACHGILDAENGLSMLRGLGYADKVRALSGKLGSSGLLRGVAPDLLGPLPVFDSTDYSTSPEGVAALFSRSGA
ncbi:MAG: hypothetical protein ABL963_12290 [Longimicrobiales bacterium]